MSDPTTAAAHTAHTINRVPFVAFGVPEGSRAHNGCLADLAPTILSLMGLPVPAEMTGIPLVTQVSSRQAAK